MRFHRFLGVLSLVALLTVGAVAASAGNASTSQAEICQGTNWVGNVSTWNTAITGGVMVNKSQPMALDSCKTNELIQGYGGAGSGATFVGILVSIASKISPVGTIFAGAIAGGASLNWGAASSDLLACASQGSNSGTSFTMYTSSVNGTSNAVAIVDCIPQGGGGGGTCSAPIEDNVGRLCVPNGIANKPNSSDSLDN